jgi:hypothetical protein
VLKALLLSLSASVLALGLPACGTSSTKSSPDSRLMTVIEHTLRVDPVLGPIDADDNSHLNLGHPARGAELRAMVSLVKRYYAASAAGDGKAACSMLYSVAVREAVEELPHTQGVSGMTCPAVMSAVFQKLHPWLVAKARSLRPLRVRSELLNGFVIMRFSTTPPNAAAREVALRHDHGVWSIDSPLDKPLP